MYAQLRLNTPAYTLMVALPGVVVTHTSIFVSGLAHSSHLVAATLITNNDVGHYPQLNVIQDTATAAPRQSTCGYGYRVCVQTASDLGSVELEVRPRIFSAARGLMLKAIENNG